MGVYFLNISVDTAEPISVSEDLSFNDQESIVEIVVEKILGFENAFQEYDDHDMEDQNTNNHVKIDLVVPFFNNLNTTDLVVGTEKKQLFDFDTLLKSEFLQIDTPPPKIWSVFCVSLDSKHTSDLGNFLINSH